MIRNLIPIKSLGELWHGLISVFKRSVGGGKIMGWSQDQGVLARSWPVILSPHELGVLKGKLGAPEQLACTASITVMREPIVLELCIDMN